MEVKKATLLSRKQKKARLFVSMVATLMSLFAIGCFAAEGDPSLALNFNMTELFSWAQMILDCLMPVLYVTLGVSLAFIIANALKSAFGRY